MNEHNLTEEEIQVLVEDHIEAEETYRWICEESGQWGIK